MIPPQTKEMQHWSLVSIKRCSSMFRDVCLMCLRVSAACIVDTHEVDAILMPSIIGTKIDIRKICKSIGAVRTLGISV